MTQYVMRRLLQAIPLLLLISFTVFMLMQLIPGGPMAAYENNPNISAEDLERLREELGLNVPKHIQYINWLSAVLRGDWGTSQITRRPALVEIAEKLPNTIYLSMVSFIIALVISIPIGIISAVRQYSWFDHVMTTFAFIGHSLPVFWMGLIFIIVFHATLKNPFTGGPLLPGGGMYTLGSVPTLGDRLRHLIMPASVLAIYSLTTHIRYMRAGMLDVLHQDYIRTARAKGAGRFRILIVHALKNIGVPVVTVVGTSFAALLGGVVVTESVFGLPGLGRLTVEAVLSRDFPTIQTVILLFSVVYVVINLLIDISYTLFDPRIRY